MYIYRNSDNIGHLDNIGNLLSIIGNSGMGEKLPMNGYPVRASFHAASRSLFFVFASCF